MRYTGQIRSVRKSTVPSTVPCTLEAAGQLQQQPPPSRPQQQKKKTKKNAETLIRNSSRSRHGWREREVAGQLHLWHIRQPRSDRRHDRRAEVKIRTGDALRHVDLPDQTCATVGATEQAHEKHRIFVRDRRQRNNKYTGRVLRVNFYYTW